MKKLTTIFILCILTLCNGCLAGCTSEATPLEQGKPVQPGGGDNNDPNDPVVPAPKTKFNNFNMVGVDHFGRSFSTVSNFKKDRQVGMFYWPWIGQPYASGIYDATKIMALPNGLKTLTDFKHHDRAISPDGQAHYWGEPLWGYYNSADEWVIRKQMQMLTAAGVDFLFFDTTNAITYANVFLKVCAVIDEMLKNGWDAPKVVFYTHSHSFETVRTLYRELYQPNHFPNTWYMKNGKPLIIAYTNADDDLREAASRSDTKYQPGILSEEIRNFFHFMKPQWPFDPIYADGFPWIEWTFPQPYHSEAQVMNVTVASHPKVPMSFSLTRGWVNWGRGWDPSTRQNISANVEKGSFFQTQWDHAILMDPPMVSVGGWNEWIAYKQPFEGEYMLCDAVDKEYSRDIEPMVGGHQDAFYLQLIDNIRRYKGIDEAQTLSKGKTIDLNGALSQWNDVDYIVRNMDEKFIERDSPGGSTTVRYTQAPPVNKPVEVRVVNDAQNIYIYLKGQSAWAGNTGDANWLNILIGTGEPKLNEWESYEYIVGRKISNTNASIEKFNGGNFSSVTASGNASFSKDNDVIQLSIPRSAIGMNKGAKFYFKVAMGVNMPSNIMNYYQTGSVMPMGRLSYMYVMCN